MQIRTIGVVGAGQMGGGIAQVAAEAGHDVVLHDIEEPFLSRGLGAVRKNLDRAVEKGKATAEHRDAALARIKGTTSLQDRSQVRIAAGYLAGLPIRQGPLCRRRT